MSFPQAAVSGVHDSTPHPSAPDVLAAKDAEIARLKNEIDTLKASAYLTPFSTVISYTHLLYI